MNRAVRHGVACLLVLAGAPALAMYRCGNVFQDKPCESGTEIRLSPSGRPINRPAAAPAAPTAPAAATGAPSAAPATPSSFAAACARVGDQAQRIAWKREGGATQEQQLAERATVLSQNEQARTIAAVYARRGSAPEVRAVIEAECIVEKQKEAEAADLLRQLRKQGGETAGAPAPAPRAAPASPAESAQSVATPASTKPSEAACASLRRPLDDVDSRLRQGGSARTMEFLQAERRRAQASLRSAGCS